MNEQAETKRPYRFYKVLTWALLGAVLVYIVCAMSLTSEHTWETPFYNAGDISEVSINPFRREAVQDGGTQEADGTVTLEQGSFRYTLSFKGYSEDWQYFCIRIDDLTADTLAATATYEQVVDGAVEGSVTQTYTLTEGMNVLTLPAQKFSHVRLSFRGASGTSFVVGKLQFQENPPISVTGLMVLWGVLTAAAYLVLSGILWILYRRSVRRGHPWHLPLYGGINILQEMYLAIAGRLAAVQGRFSINPKRRRIIRTCLFLGMLFYCMTVIFERQYRPLFRFQGLLVVLILCAIAFFCIEGAPKKKDWNNPLVWAWIAVAVMMCISDFVTTKQANYYPWIGFVLIAFVGFFIFVWNNMEHRDEILEDFARAVHIFFWITVVYCVLFRPHDPAVRYAGITNNPNGMGVYTAIFWAVVLASLEYALRTHAKKRLLFLYIVEACLVFSLAWKAQSATALIAIALVAVVWLIRMIVYAFHHQRKKALLGVLISAVVLFLPLHIALSEGLIHVPYVLGTEMSYADDVQIERTTLGTVVYAADAEEENALTDSRLFGKLTSVTWAQALSGRNYIYKEYLRDMNWFGHNTWPDVFGQNNPRNAHNEVLNQGYRYGIFTVIPYIVMLVAVLARTWRYGGRSRRYAILPFFVCLAAIVESMGDVVMTPFHWPTWFGLYLLMGCAFCEEDMVGDADDLCYHQQIESEWKDPAQAEKENTVGEKI